MVKPKPDIYDKPEVNLVVNATDPDGDGLQYEYYFIVDDGSDSIS